VIRRLSARGLACYRRRPRSPVAMRLRRVDILGFKSFRARTAVEVADGVTAIVGPNGCGKSNIVDAIRWALGAQNARELRGREMHDVIFAGSESHAPTGFAEVSLVFENDRLDLPAPWREVPEVRVTRRLHRTGESEYEINGDGVRLRDVTELFLGTGVGAREAYSIIEQGKVGFIVQARPEERRVLIEEAAGITRYRYQRKTAERRLEQTRDNLTRLHDILGEVTRQVASLERQAERAARWKALAARRRVLEVTVAVDRIDRLIAELAGVRPEAHAIEERRAAASAARGRAEAALQTARVDAFATERTLNEAQEAAYSARARAELLANSLQHMRRERDELVARLERVVGERDEQRRSLEAADADAGRGDLEVQAAVAERDTAAAALRDAEATLAAARAARGRATDALRAVDARVAALRSDLAVAEGRAASARIERERLAERRAEVDGEVARHGEEHARAAAALAEREREASAAAGVLASAEAALAQARSNEAAAREALHAAQRGEREATATATAAATRASSLDRALSSGAGLDAGVRTLLEAASRGEVAGVQRTVAEHLRVEAGHERAVAAALGGWADAVVVEGREALSTVLRWCRAKKLAVPLALLADPVSGEVAEGCLAHAPIPALVARRLRDAARVPDAAAAPLPAAEVVVDAHGVCVTGGVVFEPGAASRSSAEQIFALGRERDEAQRVAAVAVAARESAEAARSLADQQLEAALLQRESAREAAEGARRASTELAAAASTARLDAERAERAATRAQADASAALARAQALEADERGAAEAAARLAAEVDAIAEARATADAEALRAEEAERAAADEVADRRAQAAATAERVRSAQAATERSRGARAAAASRLERLEQELRAGAHRRGELEAALDADAGTLVALEAARLAAEGAFETARTAHDAASAALVDGEAAAARARAEFEAAALAGRDVELRIERLTAAIQAQEHALQERFELSLVAARGEALPELDANALAELDEVVARLDRLGAINPNAEEEFAEAKERETFLTAQRVDLETALADLEAAIRRMDETSRALFEQTFHAVNERFEVLFPRLFRGGRARLELTEPENMLETGIEIVCQPPGKRLQSMTLMSGGEKALTAVALIFAIFQMKPTPFCILDEVDAPLDEGNVVRFSEMVAEMSSISQFLLITHNKRTMETARTLYGVTMEEPGVSKVVGVRLHGREPDSPGSEAPSA
jgi:chromosome segregation protein